MKGMVSFYLALYIAFLCASSARIQPLAFDHEVSFDSFAPAPSIIPSEDSDFEPALSPEPSAESPESAWQPLEGVFDVTQHGAIADGKTENSQAFLATWDAACSNARKSTFFIPEGTFFVGPVLFHGPCKNNQSPVVKIEGTLLAPPNLDAFPNSDWIVFEDLEGLVITGGTGVTNFDGQGGVEAWKQESGEKSKKCEASINSLKFSNVSDGSIDTISMINTPGDSPNTDGIHIGSSTDIRITSSAIGVGDDCVSMSININISDVSCGPGHGISVGSLGKDKNEENVQWITVQNCTINGTQNGVRIKTFPGSEASSAPNITFEDIKMINVSNPVIVDQEYCPGGNCDLSKPSQVKPSDITFKNVNGTYNTEFAATLKCSSSTPCENIKIIDVNLNSTVSNGSVSGKDRLNVKGLVKGLLVENSTFF